MIRRAAAVIRSAPVTSAYVAVVAAIAVASWLAGDTFADRLVRDSSTDLDNLATTPIWALASSAFVLDHLSQVALLPFLALAMGTVERWRGSLAAVVTFVVGHIGASLLVAAWLAAGIALGWLGPAYGQVVDVGVSYGEAALWGLLVARVPRRWRPVYLGSQGIALLLFVAVRHGFTDVGHLIGWTLGLVLAVVVIRRSRSAPPAVPGPPATPTRAR
jgi:hypothetical protein